MSERSSVNGESFVSPKKIVEQSVADDVSGVVESINSPDQIDFTDAPALEFKTKKSTPEINNKVAESFLGEKFNNKINADTHSEFSDWLFQKYPQLLPSSDLPPHIQEQQKQEIAAQIITDNTEQIFSDEDKAERADELIESSILAEERDIYEKTTEILTEENRELLLEINFDRDTGLRTAASATNYLVEVVNRFDINTGDQETDQNNLEKRIDFLQRFDFIGTDLQNMKAANDNIAGQEKVDECLKHIGKFHSYLAETVNRGSDGWGEAVFTLEQQVQDALSKLSDNQDKAIIENQLRAENQVIMDSIDGDSQVQELIGELRSLVDVYMPFRQYDSGDEYMYGFVTKENSTENNEQAKNIIDQLATKVLDRIQLNVDAKIKGADTYHGEARSGFANFFDNYRAKYPREAATQINDALATQSNLGEYAMSSLLEYKAVRNVFDAYKKTVFAEYFTKFLNENDNSFLDPLDDGQPFLFGFVGSYTNENNLFAQHLSDKEKAKYLPKYEDGLIPPESNRDEVDAIAANPGEAINEYFLRVLEAGVNTNKSSKNHISVINAYTGNAQDMQRVAPQTVGDRKIKGLNMDVVVRVLRDIYDDIDISTITNSELRSFLTEWHGATDPNNLTLNDVMDKLNQRSSDRRSEQAPISSQEGSSLVEAA
ncbi:MAG: hypothetical protein LBG64_00130 [Pseudomonadales bacterium]|jgi:hypothetical protein|nr:hypothetical protein [Pseudomonadales bacterium]